MYRLTGFHSFRPAHVLEHRHTSPLRRILVATVLFLLLVIAGGAIAGSMDQLSADLTAWQLVQSVCQLMFGLLSLLIIGMRILRLQTHVALLAGWAACLVFAAGLSGLVWGPPMILTAVLFAMLAAGFAWLVVRMLDRPRPVEHVQA